MGAGILGALKHKRHDRLENTRIMEVQVVVIGGGHAGCEAALAAARLGCKTVLATLDASKIGQMSCNPSIGGLGKGQLVREIDALGGEMGRAADRTAVQIKMLNTSKGAAVQSLRSQNDRAAYRLYMQEIITRQSNLQIVEGEIVEIRTEQDRVIGVEFCDGTFLPTTAVVVATGTFLNGLLHTGFDQHPGGRAGEAPATGLTETLKRLGFEIGRLKTGTPPRLDGTTVNYQPMQVLEGDSDPEHFSFDSPRIMDSSLPCYLTYTNLRTHEIIRMGLDRSPLFTGVIKGLGPRYCPSIEDKIVRFADKDRHQIILEPDGRDTDEIYLNGFSTSLPEDIQTAAVHSIVGLEHAVIVKYGYAVEYDYVPPTQITASLETRHIRGLYLAGQINGTTGYEEAAAQGLMAGINAGLAVHQRAPVILDRSEAYIGVMIDDLITKGAEEPYRMFTSRAEYRLLLRHDNADLRLARHAYEIGLLSDDRFEEIQQKIATVGHEVDRLKTTYVQPDRVNPILAALGSSQLSEPVSLAQLIARPELSYQCLATIDGGRTLLSSDIGDQVQTVIKYDGYIKKQTMEIDRQRRWEHHPIPSDFPYEEIAALSRESREKLTRTRPLTIGQASRVPGVTPADIAILTVLLERNRKTIPS